MRNEMFAHIQSLSFANLDRMQTGQLMTRLSNDVDTVRTFASAGLALLLRAGLMVLGSLVMVLWVDWQLALIVAVMLAVAGVIIRMILRNVQPLFSIVQQKLGALNTLVQENLAGVQVVKAFVREPHAVEQFESGNQAYLRENVRVGRLLALAIPLLALVTNVGMVAVIWFGGLDTINGRISVGELVAFNNYLLIGMAPLLLLSNMLAMVSRAGASADRVLELLATEPAIRTAASPHRSPNIRGEVVFDNVSFHYAANGQTPALAGPASSQNGAQPNSNGDRPAEGEVLAHVSFRVSPGQTVALLGATGSGKSTLVNLIPRFYDVTGGRVMVDGLDVRQWAPDALRARIGVVLQQTTLFSGTIRANIAFGRPDASLEAVIAAAQAAQAHDFIMALPGGYDSPVEERGANLSGGQRQRIAIARALLIAPSILVLDDSTSAVDMETEFKLQEALEQLMAGCTTFVVAQRISSVLNADQILVLENGRIAAQGAHHQLLESSTLYQEIFRSQLGQSH
jgi:ATP-binding cassette subfamily B protein